MSPEDGADYEDLKPLTALRFFAAAWVVLYDYWPRFTAERPPVIDHGRLGVELFFVLSGFILLHVYGGEWGGFCCNSICGEPCLLPCTELACHCPDRTHVFDRCSVQTSPLAGGSGDVGATRTGTAAYWWLWPNFMVNVSDGVMDTNLVLPLGVDRCRVIFDFYFGPEKVTLKEGQSINWVWAEANTYPHDVHLKSGPKSLKGKASYSTKTTAVTNAEFEKTFTTPGTYKFICTIHPTQMHMTVVVKK